jgi:hypothetical protein
MKEVIRDGKVIWSKDCIGYVIEWEDAAIDEIIKRGILVGQLGKTHFYNPANHNKLELMVNA